ncbi:DUF115 domain-containing protein [bacterium]|nr:DUF115 domain-containing protein [bacterium]
MIAKSEFELFQSAAGHLSARHRASGVLLHSARNPMEEARVVASSLCKTPGRAIVIVGDGLGYLSEALRAQKRSVRVIEPFPEIACLRKGCARSFASESNEDTHRALQWLLQDGESEIYIAPYVRSQIDLLPNDVADAINVLVVLRNSRDEYAKLISENIRTNRAHLSNTRKLSLRELHRREIAVACGSGPSLMPAIAPMRASRDLFTLVSCSSAVPLLCEHGLTPDWTIALEAHDGVARDLEALPEGSSVAVFEWTDPQVLHMSALDLYLAGGEDMCLVTGGGTTLLTAADLASKIATRVICLAGADLSWSHGAYAESDSSACTMSERRSAPKFALMRRSLEQWITDKKGRRVLHVVNDRSLLLNGAEQIAPVPLASAMKDIMMHLSESVEQ